MRRTTFVVVSSLVSMMILPVVAEHANAKPIRLSGTYGKSRIKADCDAAGGVYTEGSSGYGCAAPGGGAVHCNNKGLCQGNNPSTIVSGKTPPAPTAPKPVGVNAGDGATKPIHTVPDKPITTSNGSNGNYHGGGMNQGGGHRNR